MKRTLSILLVCALLVGVMLTFSSCSNILFGEYSSDLLNTTYEFSFNKVTKTTEVLGKYVVKEGTYKISGEEGERTITFTFDGEEETYDFSQGTVEDDKYIEIGVFKYYEDD